ncbi:MAG: hypothetical protein CVU42_08130 [Chloroflexi bacterium HGW-Chloroflexi-4]|jgi:GNAT superfamily N-acetyltransferase|nr:MAG: hypothetical protein CVU42_08130 [Chloroflexi bacterium HGW-Chloroflexi-4]
MRDDRYNVKFEQCSSLEDIADLRNQYLDRLIEPQELFLELIIVKASIYLIYNNEEQIGYFLTNNESVLIEYFIIQKYVFLAESIFTSIIKDLPINKVLCKSFDHLLLSSCVGLQKKTRVVGILFREYHPNNNKDHHPEITVRQAVIDDEKHVIEVNEEVFDHDYEVLEYINKKQLLIFEKEGTPIGFGIFSRVIEGRPDFDIGMLVEKEYRGQGIGQFIISTLADHCIKNGWRPVAGCAVENTASRRTLEKAGFTAGYRMLEFSF